MFLLSKKIALDNSIVISSQFVTRNLIKLGGYYKQSSLKIPISVHLALAAENISETYHPYVKISNDKNHVFLFYQLPYPGPIDGKMKKLRRKRICYSVFDVFFFMKKALFCLYGKYLCKVLLILSEKPQTWQRIVFIHHKEFNQTEKSVPNYT